MMFDKEVNSTIDISVQDALRRVLDCFVLGKGELAGLTEGRGRILAESIIASTSLPPFANSSMDGYALKAEDVFGASAVNPRPLKVIGDIAAGQTQDIEIIAGTAARIMTGAPMPLGANAVVPVEATDEAWREKDRPLSDSIKIFKQVHTGDYVRPVGGDVREGEVVIEKGTKIRPFEVAMMAAMGVSEVEVVKRPIIAILATGDELLDIDQPLTAGKIRNSNGYALAAQIEEAGGIPLTLGIAKDTKEDVRAKLQIGLDHNVDMFVSSAGVSVGAYDVVKAVLEEAGNVGFWRVRMRPGKPFAFGTYGDIPYFGLPGNPVSTMLSFERFVRPAIRKMCGFRDIERPLITATIQHDIDSDGRESYLRAIIEKTADGYQATLTGDQSSHMISSLLQANGIVIVPEDVKYIAQNTPLQGFLLT